MKKLFAGMLAVTVLTGPTFAQQGKQKAPSTPLEIEEAEKKKAAAQSEKDYQAAMKKSQGHEVKPAAIDPWANMRQVDGTQPKR